MVKLGENAKTRHTALCLNVTNALCHNYLTSPATKCLIECTDVLPKLSATKRPDSYDVVPSINNK